MTTGDLASVAAVLFDHVRAWPPGGEDPLPHQLDGKYLTLLFPAPEPQRWVCLRSDTGFVDVHEDALDVQWSAGSEASPEGILAVGEVMLK